MNIREIAFATACVTAMIAATSEKSAPIPTWNGPTQYACDGRCDQAWAETQLTTDELAELALVRAINPAPAFIEVHPGDLFGLQTFYRDAPVSSRTLTVSGTYATAWGWNMGDWSWVKIDACQNWTKVLHTASAADPTVDPRDWASSAATTIATAITAPITGPLPWVPTGPVTDPWTPPTIVVVVDPDRDPKKPVIDPTDPTPPAPAPVPLPAAAWLLLAGLAGLVAVKKGVM